VILEVVVEGILVDRDRVRARIRAALIAVVMTDDDEVIIPVVGALPATGVGPNLADGSGHHAEPDD
jgi:hypothetical protein